MSVPVASVTGKVSLTCFVCDKADSTVKKFKDSTLRKCKSSLRCHIYYNLRYNDKKVPESIDEVTGYHTQCYSNFNALNEKYRSVPEADDATCPDSPNVSQDIVNVRYVSHHYVS